ncbi:hypothetical protein Lbir_0215 [Legionella birminghamensis]|uniref:Uncharacterized protein n=1 Tax=Legionella birminghamensis TaxID=28083 RepID=A0A378IBN4_9GAMM|nr:hypothetical protein Lbir_0215 [Legionella birminghamensis]STX32230.1 Uncharacterised protein [Legionella birminghamensis]
MSAASTHTICKNAVESPRHQPRGPCLMPEHALQMNSNVAENSNLKAVRNKSLKHYP